MSPQFRIPEFENYTPIHTHTHVHTDTHTRTQLQLFTVPITILRVNQMGIGLIWRTTEEIIRKQVTNAVRAVSSFSVNGSDWITLAEQRKLYNQATPSDRQTPPLWPMLKDSSEFSKESRRLAWKNAHFGLKIDIDIFDPELIAEAWASLKDSWGILKDRYIQLGRISNSLETIAEE